MNLLRCRGVSKRWGATRALDEVDLDVDKGAPLALVGPNGAGKTTLMAIVCGFVRADAGDVEVLGAPPGSAHLVGRVAALPQDAQLDPRTTVGRQLLHFARLQGMSRGEARRDVDRVLALVGLAESARSGPAELSHGMRKRIAIAQSLLGNPQLVLLDEPTAGLDPENARIVRQVITEQSVDTGFVVSSHNLDELERLCGSVVYIDEGRIRQQDTLGESSKSGFLTLGVEPANVDAVCTLLSAVNGVGSVSHSGQGNLVISHDPQSAPQMDIAVLQALAEEGLDYRHLIRGRTLEDRLFQPGGPGVYR